MSTHQVDIQPWTGTIPDSLRVIVLDCDGVLFDSKEANVRFYNHILQQIGSRPVRPDQREYIHMYPVRESLRYLLEEESHFQEAWNYSQTIDFQEFNKHLSCEPGLVEFLAGAKRRYQIALATNRTVSTHQVLALFDLDQYFDLVVSALDVQFPKPHPESMEKIFERFGVSSHQVLYIGDSSVDEALAEATGVHFVAYKNPKLKAHMHIRHFRELHPVVF
jgi:phosphoglycolate phosphatase